MPRVFSGRELAKIFLNKYGFKEISISGSHLKMRKNENNLVITIIIPLHQEVMIGTFYSILRQAKINKSDFIKKSEE